MLQVLDTRDGLSSYSFTALSDINTAALLSLLEEAWQADYRGQPRLVLDASYLRWLLVEQPVWVGVLICTADDRPVGCLLCLERTLYCHHTPLRAYYNTLFTVSSQYRRRGVGRWLIHCANHALFAERGADLVCVSFHQGHAGLPAVQATHAPMANWGVHCFHQAASWGRLLTRAPVPAPESLSAVTRIGLSPCEDRFTAEPGRPVPGSLPSVGALTEELSAHHEVAFGVGKSFRTRYLDPDSGRAGTLWLEFDRHTQCWISYDLVDLVEDQHPWGRLGRIQTVYGRQCNTAQYQQAMQYVCHLFQEQGCTAAGVLENGSIPHEALSSLFRPRDEYHILTVRGPQSALRAFEGVSPPYWFDL